VNGEVHGGRPRPTGAVVPRKKKWIITMEILPFPLPTGYPSKAESSTALHSVDEENTVG
jgi:hypothetical protein